MTAQSLLGEWGTYGLLGALAIALLVAAGTDIHRRQIDNWLNGAIALAAPLFWWACDLDAPAIGMQLLSAALCLVAMWALFALRMMGGGDVKLLVALALWIKPLWFLKLLMLMAISIVLAVWHLWGRRKDRLTVPYGVAISGAGLWVVAHDYLAILPGGGPVG